MRAARAGVVSLAIISIVGATVANPAGGQEPRHVTPGLDLYMPVPADNPLRREVVALGRTLFMDPILSADRSIACASCHRPDGGFTSPRTTSVGVYGRHGKRNVPAIINRGYGHAFFWDGRIETLEAQVLQPIIARDEMDLTLAEAVERLKSSPVHAGRFRAVFGRPVNETDLGRALASYVRTIRSEGSAFDRFAAGDSTALTPLERRGLDLFQGQARCVRCHTGTNLTDELMHNTGVAWADGEFRDGGRALVTGVDGDRGAFKTPTLREVARTAPYMHDGSLATLAEVVQFYSDGGRANPNLDSRITRLDLSDGERAALVAFLKALTGTIQEGPREGGATGLAAPAVASARSTVYPERLARIPARMQELVDDGTIAGAVMLLARHDTVLLLEAVGYADLGSRTPMRVDHIFSLASIAKPVTALGVMMLQEDGLLTTGDFVARHLPEFEGLRVAEPGPGSRGPLIRELMTHTSGLDSEGALFDHDTFFDESLATVVAGYATTPLAYEPGTRQVYSSPGFDTLGRIIEVVSGRSFESFMEQRLFGPLGMRDTGFFVAPEKQARVPSHYWHVDGVLSERALTVSWSDRRFPAPAFGLHATAADLGALMQMMLNGGTHDGHRILSEAAVGAMTGNQVRADSLPARGFGWTVAGGGTPDLEISLASGRIFGHGGATGPVVWADPERDLAGVLLIHQADMDVRYARRVFAELAFAAVTPPN